MSSRLSARAWTLALMAVLALGVTACGRHAQVKKHTSAPAAAASGHHKNGTSGAAMGALNVNTNAEGESDTGDDHTQDQSDRSLEHLAALPDQAQLPQGRWKPGVNYQPLVPAQSTMVAPGKVEVLEVFWLGCPHCYALEPALQKWLQTKPSWVEFVRVPVMWGPAHRAHARLYYTLLALGKPELVQKAFDTIQHGDVLLANSDEDTLKVQESFAKANGISPEDFAKAYDSDAVQKNLARAEDLTQRYQVNSVPLVVIDGKYSADLTSAGSPAALISLVDDLAAAEHNRGGRT